ncbi:MAG: M1 family metallopeptidase [Thermoanaerobaculia bacterium]
MQHPVARLAALLLCLHVLGCDEKPRGGSEPLSAATPTALPAAVRDVHSYADPGSARVRHVDLDLEVVFPERILKGAAALRVERPAGSDAPLVLDTRDLAIERVESSQDGASWSPAEFQLGPSDKVRGAPLTVMLPADATQARVSYRTSPRARALQWLEPSQTAGRKHPFLFTQSQAIHARSWIPLQDSPGIRVTYTARIRTPPQLSAVMSARNDPKAARGGEYRFEMPQAIPSYLIALAVGDLGFAPIGRRSGVYAEPPVLPPAASEFADTERMMEATERLFGPYRWERYDLLVLPPSFPFGGMENPRLTFATPTILAGDRSLVSLVAHELAHSWSGNLVTNATWRDFWINEGVTTYIERRIMEELYGRERAEMEWVLGRQDLEKEIAGIADELEILHMDLSARDPDDGFTDVPYEKGALFLRHLEEVFGRERFDPFLRNFFDEFAFRSITTEEFVGYLEERLLAQARDQAARIPLKEWIESPGIPASAPRFASARFSAVEDQGRRWIAGELSASAIPAQKWTTHEWLHFLRALPSPLQGGKMADLDRAFRLTGAGNAEITNQWLLMTIAAGYEPGFQRLEEFLTSMGRRKFVKPLFEALVKTEEGRRRALAIYRKTRPLYHPITVETVDEIVKWPA